MKFRLLVVFAFGMTVSACGSDKLHYSEDAWKAAPEAERYRFVDDLIDRKLLLEKREAEIERMLGPPSFSADDLSYVTYVVRLGKGQSLFDTITLLDIRFDPSTHRCTKAFVRGN